MTGTLSKFQLDEGPEKTKGKRKKSLITDNVK